MAAHEQRDGFDSSPANKKFQNKADVILVWLTKTQSSTETHDRELTLESLRKINSDVVDFNQSSQCLSYIEQIEHERVFVIVDGKLFDEISDASRRSKVIDSVYIFCMRKERYELKRQHPKVRGNPQKFESLFFGVLFLQKSLREMKSFLKDCLRTSMQLKNRF